MEEVLAPAPGAEPSTAQGDGRSQGALLTDPTHSQGVFPGETHFTRSYIHTLALHAPLSANSKINTAGPQGQQGWTESCSHVAPAEAQVPLLRESDIPANILNFPSPPSFPPLPLPPPPHLIFLLTFNTRGFGLKYLLWSDFPQEPYQLHLLYELLDLGVPPALQS